MGKTRAQPPKAGITLDTGALIALDRGNGRMIALLERALAETPFVYPREWSDKLRDGQRQTVLARFLRSAEVSIAPLDEYLSRSCGELCAAAGTSDVIDASVVILARQHHDVIVTSDAGDLERLDPKSQIIEISGM